MANVWKLFKQGWVAIPNTGRRTLWIYGASLTFLSLIDAAALYILSKSVLANNTTEINVDGIGRSLALVIVLFLMRSIFATAISYWGVKQFAQQEVQLGSDGYARINNLGWDRRQSVSAVDLYSSVDRGPFSLVQGVMISVVSIITELISGLVILMAILFMQPLTAVVALLYFVIVALIQHRVLSVASQSAGERVIRATQETYQKLSDANSIAKLLAISPSRSFEESLNSTRAELAYARASSSFLALLPRYFMESVLAVGFLVVSGSAYIAGGSAAAAAALTVFAAAGFRLLPIVNRIQGLTLLVFSLEPTAKLTFLTETLFPETIEPEPSTAHPSNVESEILVSLQGVSYRYPSATQFAVKDLSIELKAGLQYAVVGPSGAGKTTLVDICLGLLTPQQGKVVKSKQSTETNVSYVPQETNLISGTLFSNVALEWNESEISETKVREAIHAAQIDGLLTDEDSIESLLGDGAASVSGGQKQRIGLARALYRNPGFLVLDEATSALDSETERAVMDSVDRLRGKATVLIVAHRLSTVKDVDQVIYMEDGNIQGVGTFLELKESIPGFARQIELGTLGLVD
jgi:ABC-type multidrug transport system fused ATPase/permease subunit